MVFDGWLLFWSDILTCAAPKDCRTFARRDAFSPAICLPVASVPSYDPRFNRQMRR